MHELSGFATGGIWFITGMYIGAFGLYFGPHLQAFDSLSAPDPPTHKKKKGKFSGISLREGLGTAGIHWCINIY